MHALKLFVTTLPRKVRARAHDASRRLAPKPAGAFWAGYFAGVALLVWVLA